MSRLSVEDLKAYRRAIGWELAEVGRETMRRQGARRTWVLTELLKNALLSIFFLANGVTEPAVVFLCDQGQRKGWPHRDDASLARHSKDKFKSEILTS